MQDKAKYNQIGRLYQASVELSPFFYQVRVRDHEM